jgi:hypothetical protein
MGDFVQVQSNQMVRIDYICVHKYEGVGRLFIKATPIDSQQPATEDPILGSGYWHLQLATPPEETILLYGLPAILPRLLYLVPIASDGPDLISLVDDRTTAKEFLWIERTLQWL